LTHFLKDINNKIAVNHFSFPYFKVAAHVACHLFK